MTFPIHAAATAALTALVSSTSLAQSPPRGPAPAAATAPSASASAAAARISLSSLTYRSAFEGYRGYTEQPVTSWREANDLVGRIGGWQAYAREGQRGVGGTSPKEGAAMPGHAGTAMPGANAGGNTDTPTPKSPAASSPGLSPAPVKAPPVSEPGIPPAPPASDAHSGHKAP